MLNIPGQGNIIFGTNRGGTGAVHTLGTHGAASAVSDDPRCSSSLDAASAVSSCLERAHCVPRDAASAVSLANVPGLGDRNPPSCCLGGYSEDGILERLFPISPAYCTGEGYGPGAKRGVVSTAHLSPKKAIGDLCSRLDTAPP